MLTTLVEKGHGVDIPPFAPGWPNKRPGEHNWLAARGQLVARAPPPACHWMTPPSGCRLFVKPRAAIFSVAAPDRFPLRRYTTYEHRVDQADRRVGRVLAAASDLGAVHHQ